MNIPIMQFFTWISRNSQSKSLMLCWHFFIWLTLFVEIRMITILIKTRVDDASNRKVLRRSWIQTVLKRGHRYAFVVGMWWPLLLHWGSCRRETLKLLLVSYNSSAQVVLWLDISGARYRPPPHETISKPLSSFGCLSIQGDNTSPTVFLFFSNQLFFAMLCVL